jgi:hypothetical protein
VELDNERKRKKKLTQQQSVGCAHCGGGLFVSRLGIYLPLWAILASYVIGFVIYFGSLISLSI